MAKKKAETRHRRRWTDMEDKFLRSKVKANWSYAEIGESLKRTAIGVTARAHQLRNESAVEHHNGDTNGITATLDVKLSLKGKKVAEITFEPSIVQSILSGEAQVSTEGIEIPGVLTLIFREE